MQKDRLYSCIVERNDPDKDFYLLRVCDSQDNITSPLLCLMKKSHAIKPLKVGDVIVATAMGIFYEKYPLVSQKVPIHIINVLRFYLGEVLDSIDAYLDRVAATNRGKFCKIGVWGKAGLMDFYSLNKKLLKPYLGQIIQHIPHPIFIPSGTDILPFKEYKGKSFLEIQHPVSFVLNALYPADPKKLLDYVYEPERKRIFVYVKSSDVTLFLWKDYLNAKLASKLTKIAYHFVIDTGQEVIVDVYNIEKYVSEYKSKKLRTDTLNLKNKNQTDFSSL